MLEILKELWVAGVDIIFPEYCPGCNSRLNITDSDLCSQCWGRVREIIAQPFCTHCGKTAANYEIFNNRCHNCQDTKSKLDFVLRVAGYESPLKDMLWQLKYSGQSRFDRFLGELAADMALARPEFRDIDYVVPIPLHWIRQFRRGYNQSELMAAAMTRKLRHIGLNMQLSCDLVRVRNTPPQTTLSEAKRRANLAGAFAVRPDHKFQGKKICLLDDVTTTGTTLETAARILRRAGAKSVGALVILVP